MVAKSEFTPEINVENHDTIGMLCLDAQETSPAVVPQADWLIK